MYKFSAKQYKTNEYFQSENVKSFAKITYLFLQLQTKAMNPTAIIMARSQWSTRLKPLLWPLG